jgi:hypothetical protein
MANYSIKDCIDEFLKKLHNKKGKEFSEIVINWSKIAGEELSKKCIPVDMKYYKKNSEKCNILVLSLNNKSAIFEIKFSEMIIIERVNNYLGFKAISGINFK